MKKLHIPFPTGKCRRRIIVYNNISSKRKSYFQRYATNNQICTVESIAESVISVIWGRVFFVSIYVVVYFVDGSIQQIIIYCFLITAYITFALRRVFILSVVDLKFLIKHSVKYEMSSIFLRLGTLFHSSSHYVIVIYKIEISIIPNSY